MYSGTSHEEYLDTISKVAPQLVKYIKQSLDKDAPTLSQPPVQELIEQLRVDDLIAHGGLLDSKTEDWLSTYLKHTQHMHHPHYLGHQVAVPDIASGIADLIHGTINNPMAIYEMGPSGAALELAMIHWLLRKVGWFNRPSLAQIDPDGGSGVFTHGGSLANLTAMLAARSFVDPKAWENGSTNDLVILGTSIAHYSLQRAISIMGMGQKSLLAVAHDHKEVLLPEDLQRAYHKAIDQGKKIMAVTVNACATSTGLYDPIDEVADFCQSKSLWLHVDAAHGGAALLTPKYSHLTKGIHKAHSVTWDMHKMLRTSTLCAAVLFRKPTFLHEAFKQKGSYLFHDKEQPGVDFMPFTVECTKAPIASKLFWVLASKGEQHISQFVESRYLLAEQFYQFLLTQPDFETFYQPQSNILCFAYKPLAYSNEKQLALRNAIVSHKEYYITSTEVQGRRYLRVVFLNPATQLRHMEQFANHIRMVAKSLSAGLSNQSNLTYSPF